MGGLGRSKEDERSAGLAERALRGDYDNGMDGVFFEALGSTLTNWCSGRSDTRATGSKSGFPNR